MKAQLYSNMPLAFEQGSKPTKIEKQQSKETTEKVQDDPAVIVDNAPSKAKIKEAEFMLNLALCIKKGDKLTVLVMMAIHRQGAYDLNSLKASFGLVKEMNDELPTNEQLEDVEKYFKLGVALLTEVDFKKGYASKDQLETAAKDAGEIEYTWLKMFLGMDK